jgi:hypothetical protein
VSATDIFISYSREDRDRARTFADALASEGFHVWWDNALHSGETFDEVIERQLRAAKAVVVLWSPRSVTSRWVRAEATLADRRSKLAPVIIEACDRPIIFELTHTADLSHWTGDPTDHAWRVFVTDLHHLIGSTPAAAPAKPAEPPPKAPPSAPTASAAELDRKPGASVFGGAVPPTPEPEADEEENYEATQFYTKASMDELLGADEHFLEQVVDGTVDASYPVGPLGLRIGRTGPADIVLADPRVSRAHCKVDLKDGELLVEDLGSTNGTFIDDEKIHAATVLPVGSTLRVGNFSLVHEVRARAGR